MPNWTLYEGDCLEVMRELPDNSVDAIVTDPPYGLEFMGKEWDKLAVPKPGNLGGFADGNKPSFERVRRHLPAMQEWHYRWAVEALRVLKPGGHLLAFGGTRTYHRLACAIEDAGFEVRDCLMWLYGSGFPKSLDVSKAIDKKLGAERKVVGTYKTPDGRDFTKEPAGSRGYRTTELSMGRDKGAERRFITAPATDLAKKWNGWGTSLKPSHEPVILGTKPLPLNYKLGILVMETITRILGGPICRRLNVSVSDAARLFMYFLPQLERVGVNTVAESVKIRNWASGEFVRLVERNFTPNDPELNEENLNTVQRHAPILLEGVKVKKTPTGKAADLNERTDTLLSEPMTESIGLNMMLSWSNILAALLKKASMFTTETESKMITELKTLNWLLGQNTQRNTTQVNGILNAGLPCDATTVDAILSDVKRKYLDTENSFAQELVISRGNEQESQTDHQPIILARKPLSEATVAENVLRWGTGGLNIDGCRIPTSDRLGGGATSSENAVLKIAGYDRPWMHDEEKLKAFQDRMKTKVAKAETLGRFPANVLLDEEAARLLDEQTGPLHSQDPATRISRSKAKGVTGFGTGVSVEYGDSGGASRFFYVAKASKRERTMNGKVENNHPTVKPIKLMRYLCRLITPPGGTVLDPFAGSGTTLLAAVQEGFSAIGIEREPEYCEIIRKRMAEVQPALPLVR